MNFNLNGYYDDRGIWHRTKFCFMYCGQSCDCGPPGGLLYSGAHDKSVPSAHKTDAPPPTHGIERAMSDRELLELAARANWQQELADDEVSLRYSERDEGMLYLHADNQDHNGQDREFVWNPLTQNHDAFGLAVKLHIDLTVNNGTATAIWVDMDLSETHECFEYCDEAFEGMEAKVAAARRAIVRAAAELGRNIAKGDGGEV